MKVYAGGFARFFLGDWEGYNADHTDAIDPNEEEAKPEDVRTFFETFRDQLAAHLKESTATKLHWNEGKDGTYKTTNITESEFSALLIIAARAAIADKRMVPVSLQKEWFEDPAVELIQDAEDNFLPVHHLVKADSWLPADFANIIETEVPERDLILGSLFQLKIALNDMDKILNTPNEVTRKMPSQLIADARSAHESLSTLIQWSIEASMPILIEP